MKFPVPARVAFVLLLFQLPVYSQGTPKEDDFLIFDKIEAEPMYKPSLPPLKTPAPDAPAAETSKRKLPGERSLALRTVLLDVPDKSFATGRVATLTASASQEGTVVEPVVVFDGATVSLQASIEKAVKSALVANPQYPDGVTVKISAEGGYQGHERDAAGVASALLLEALGSGKALDPEAVFLGGVDEKGRITAVQRLGTRLHTLENVTAPFIGVPVASEVEVRDIALMNELEVLAKLPIVSLGTLEDARALASKDRPEKAAKAFKLFEGVTQAAATTPVAKLIKNPKFVQRLQEIVTLMPNHLSSRLMLLAANGKLPGRITFATSRQAVLKAAKPFVEVMATQHTPKEIQAVAMESGNVLLRLQPKIHPAVERYLMAVKSYLRAVNNLLDIQNDAQHAAARNKIIIEMNKLLADVQTEKEKLDKKEGVVD